MDQCKHKREHRRRKWRQTCRSAMPAICTSPSPTPEGKRPGTVRNQIQETAFLSVSHSPRPVPARLSSYAPAAMTLGYKGYDPMVQVLRSLRSANVLLPSCDVALPASKEAEGGAAGAVTGRLPPDSSIAYLNARCHIAGRVEATDNA
eukprot:3941024-Rhodomonas_salina.2